MTDRRTDPSHLKQQHPWIETEKQFFGRRHTDYDFEAKNPNKCQQVLAKLQEEQASLSRNLNKKVMHMIEKVEGEYADLEAKLGTIENDKVKVRRPSENVERDVWSADPTHDTHADPHPPPRRSRA